MLIPTLGVQDLKGFAQELPLPNCNLVGFWEVTLVFCKKECWILSNPSKAGEVGAEREVSPIELKEVSIFQRIQYLLENY